MKLTRRKIIAVAVALLVLVSTGYWILAPHEPQVAAMRAELAVASRVLAVNGRIRPRLQVDIRPSLSGELVDLPFDVGDQVVAGQMLARIDDAPEIAAIAEAEASVQAQEATLAQARRDLARFVALGQFATKRDVEQRRLAVEEGARELSRRRASVVQASEQRERRVLRAPFAGVILERPVDPGQTVGLDSVIYRLADLSSPEVTVEVDEIYAAEIRPGMEARIALPGQAKELRGRVAHVEPRVDPATGARDVRLSFLNAVPDVPSGLTVAVNIVIDVRERAISVPRGALILSPGAPRVKIIGEGGVVTERPVTFIDWPAEDVIVTKGIRAGDLILTDPNAAKSGETVRMAR